MSERTQSGILEEFRVEFQDCWRQLPNKGLFLGLLAAWLLLLHCYGNSTFGYVGTPSLFGWMWNAYSGGDGSEEHGKFVPVVVLLLFWWKRKDLMASTPAMWLPGLLLFALSLLLHVVGYLVQQPRVSIVALFAGIYGLMGLAWGWRFLWASVFPYFLLAFCIPIGSLAERVTFPLRLLVTYLSVGISQVAGFDVLRDGSRIFDSARTFQFDVAPACSGIRSLVALAALTTIFGFVSFKTPWRRLVMVLSAFPLAVIGNVARITYTIFVTQIFGQKYGLMVEQKFGFVTFAVAIACVILMERWLREPKSAAPASGEKIA
jgi:exosortase